MRVAVVQNIESLGAGLLLGVRFEVSLGFGVGVRVENGILVGLGFGCMLGLT